VRDPDQLLVALGCTIRELRSEQRISQEELSLRTGVHRNYIGGIERAERQPTLATIARLARGLDVRTSHLLAKAEERHPPR
jgi:transcriptional regulator with XRE-family HTH domain